MLVDTQEGGVLKYTQIRVLLEKPLPKCRGFYFLAMNLDSSFKELLNK